MAIPIEDAVSACLNEMRKYYNCEKSVSWIFHKYFLALIRFYHARGICFSFSNHSFMSFSTVSFIFCHSLLVNEYSVFPISMMST